MRRTYIIILFGYRTYDSEIWIVTFSNPRFNYSVVVPSRMGTAVHHFPLQDTANNIQMHNLTLPENELARERVPKVPRDCFSRPI